MSFAVVSLTCSVSKLCTFSFVWCVFFLLKYLLCRLIRDSPIISGPQLGTISQQQWTPLSVGGQGRMGGRTTLLIDRVLRDNVLRGGPTDVYILGHPLPVVTD